MKAKRGNHKQPKLQLFVKNKIILMLRDNNMITVMTTLHHDTIMIRIQHIDDGDDDDKHGNSDATFTRRCHCCQSV
jgi:hypothetical protein